MYMYISVVRRSVNASSHSINPKHCARRVQVWKEYRKEHVAYFSLCMESYFFRVLPSAVLLTRSNLSSQISTGARRAGDDSETKETEPNVLQRQRTRE